MLKHHQLMLFVILLTNTLCCFGQHAIQFQDPKTPEVFQFEKYGFSSISEYNGRHNTSIALHHISYGDIEYPLNISYNSNGIRVDEEASSIGLGWYFGGGMISQTVLGRDDFEYPIKTPIFYDSPVPSYCIRPYPDWYYFSSPIGSQISLDPARVQMQPDTPTKDSFSMIKLRSEGSWGGTTLLFPYGSSTYNNNTLSLPNNNFYGLTQNASSGIDVEKDIFKASFNGHTITFFIQETGTIKVLNKEKYQVTRTLVSVDSGGHHYDWTIIAPDGITYKFSERLYTITGNAYPSEVHMSLATANYNPYDGFDILVPGPVDWDNGSNHISRVWKLSKIIDTKGNEVIFEYDRLPIIRSKAGADGKIRFSNLTRNSYSGSFAVGYDDFDTDVVPLSQVSNSGKHLYITPRYSNIITEKSVLKTIRYGKTEISLQLSDRIDIPYDKKIDGINISYDGTNFKNISFSNSYFNASHNDDEQKRLRLDQLIIDAKKYAFEYETDVLPDKNSLAFDYWGLYNGMPNTTSAIDPFRFMEHLNIPSWAYSLVSQIDGKANRSAHPIHAKVGMLKKIHFPTGGISEFVYELNTFDNYYIPNYDNRLNFSNGTYATDYTQTHSQGNGLRIKEIINYSNVNDIAEKIQYSYVNGKHIPPIVFMNRDPHRSVSFSMSNTFSLITKYVATGPQITGYFSNKYQTSLLGNGDGVGYDTIEARKVDNLSQSNGKIVSHYTNVPDKELRSVLSYTGVGKYEHYDSFGYAIKDTEQENGLLTKQEIFNSNDKRVKMEENTYTSIVHFSPDNAESVLSDISYNVKHLPIGTSAFIQPLVTSHALNSFSEHIFFFYPLKQTKTLLKEKKVTEYFDDEATQTIKTYKYQYDGYYRVTSSEVLGNNNQQISKEEMDYSSTILSSRHIFTVPIHKKQTENNVVIANEFYYFGLTNNIPVLNESKLVYGNNFNTDLMSHIYYDQYDDHGNILEFHKQDDIHSTIIWGYEKQYPIAVLKNLTYTDVQAHVAQLQSLSDLDNDRTIGESGSEGALRQALNNLRTLFPDAMITTYTYDPMIGLTSVTDPKGYTSYYQYDNYSRLQHIRDADGNILSTNQYNYRTQN